MFDADLPDFNMPNAFLLGLDLRALATNEDAKYIERFLTHFLKRDEEEFCDEEDFGAKEFHSQMRALKRGFKGK
ncbi:MAG: hypothetical protein JWO80_2090 [Bryobacterales bacterium]|nr:hypothetical protein [Bryobacterales bacterium]